MIRETTEGNKIELTYNHYTIAINFLDGKFIYHREGMSDNHQEEIQRFAQKYNKPLRMVDLHSFAAMVTRAQNLSEMYIVYGTEESQREDEPLYWSNRDGWVGVESGTLFHESEIPIFDPPIGGEWVRLVDTRYYKKDNQ